MEAELRLPLPRIALFVQVGDAVDLGALEVVLLVDGQLVHLLVQLRHRIQRVPPLLGALSEDILFLFLDSLYLYHLLGRRRVVAPAFLHGRARLLLHPLQGDGEPGAVLILHLHVAVYLLATAGLRVVFA